MVKDIFGQDEETQNILIQTYIGDASTDVEAMGLDHEGLVALAMERDARAAEELETTAEDADAERRDMKDVLVVD
jgi:hypothetical protein